ncbi:MAG: hypothetical protein KME35_04990 [Aphanocapsa sp. GSE-SYN-MK-11-07L]|jgi:hypothetical protein|nr:hypothetical protein [Aphanocapsa sp. GSE-SYN-MK-11-07L]
MSGFALKIVPEGIAIQFKPNPLKRSPFHKTHPAAPAFLKGGKDFAGYAD